MKSKVFHKILLLLLLNVQVTAQYRIAPLYIWSDSFNIRMHVNSFMLDDALSSTPLSINNQGFNLINLFRYDAIAKSPYKKALVTHYKLPNTDYVLINRDSLLLSLRRLTVSKYFQDSFTLEYNADGYIVNQSTINKSGERKLIATYTYEKKVDNKQMICVNKYKTERVSKNYFNNCGSVSGSINDTSITMVHLDVSGNITSVDIDSRQWVGNCPIFDTQKYKQAQRYEYNTNGRLLSAIYSYPVTNKVYHTETYLYKSIKQKDVPVLQIPKMQQLLSSISLGNIDSVTVTTLFDTIEHYPNKLSITRSLLLVHDNNGCLRLSSDVEDNSFIVSGWGTDSFIDYRNAVNIIVDPNDTSSAVYNPSKPPIYRDVSMHGIKEIVLDVPPGVFKCVGFNSSTKATVDEKAGWFSVSYDGYQGLVQDDYYSTSYNPYTRYEEPWIDWNTNIFAPLQKHCYCNRYIHITPQNFVLVDTSGLVKFVYNRGHLFKIDYR